MPSCFSDVPFPPCVESLSAEKKVLHPRAIPWSGKHLHTEGHGTLRPRTWIALDLGIPAKRAAKSSKKIHLKRIEYPVRMPSSRMPCALNICVPYELMNIVSVLLILDLQMLLQSFDHLELNTSPCMRRASLDVTAAQCGKPTAVCFKACSPNGFTPLYMASHRSNFSKAIMLLLSSICFTCHKVLPITLAKKSLKKGRYSKAVKLSLISPL